MSQVSHFQRYSQAENHATNNTLLVLRHLYQHSPFKLQTLLQTILEETQVTVGVSFVQQRRGSASIPDACISQDAFHVFVEAKRGGDLEEAQIARHLTTINDERKHGIYYLLALTKEALNQSTLDFYKAKAEKFHVAFVNVTFSGLVTALRKQYAPHEQTLSSIINDYESFLSGEGLLEAQNHWLMVVPCGTSIAENCRFGIYYEPDTRPSKAHYRYLGLYHNKAVRYIGSIVAIATMDGPPDLCNFKMEKGELDEGHCQRIRDIIAQTTYYNLESGLRFYLVDSFVETLARKTSPGGIMGIRYLELSKLSKNHQPSGDISTADIAKILNGATWT